MKLYVYFSCSHSAQREQRNDTDLECSIRLLVEVDVLTKQFSKYCNSFITIFGFFFICCHSILSFGFSIPHFVVMNYPHGVNAKYT